MGMQKGGKHSDETKKKISLSHVGITPSMETRYKISQSGRDRAERRRVDRHNYKCVYMPDHPNCRAHGRVYEHRVVAEQMIGRFLTDNEVVHHINGKRNDNRPENLQVMSKKEHERLRWKGRTHTDETKAKMSAAAKRVWMRRRKDHE